MPTVGWFFSAYFGQHQIRDINMHFEVPSLYLILTKLGDIIDRLTRNLSEKCEACPIIRHYVTAQSNVFYLIFIIISTPISTKFFGQL